MTTSKDFQEWVTETGATSLDEIQENYEKLLQAALAELGTDAERIAFLKKVVRILEDPDGTPVPGHIRTVQDSNFGMFCSREGLIEPRGQCPDGCDHAPHYSNDGHPECADDTR